MSFLRKYNTPLDANTALRVSIRKAGSGAYATNTDWVPAVGEVKLSVDGATEVNIDALPIYTNGSWVFLLTAARLSGKQTRIRVAAAAVDHWDETIETFGNPAAMWPDNWANQLLPAALVGGKMDASIGSLAPGSITTLTLDPQVYAAITDSVWDEPLSGHVTGSGSTGAALGAAGSAGDPWITDLTPYGPGTAGELVRNNLNAPVTSRSVPGDAMALTNEERDAVADAHFARPLPTNPVIDTAGEALFSARAQAFGKWMIDGDILTLYASDGVTTLKAFNLAPAGGNPWLSRTPV